MAKKCSSEDCTCTKAIKYDCAVCQQLFCRDCCKRYVALESGLSGPAEQVRTCNACFLKNVAWDSSRTFDVLGPADGKPVVLVHGALIGRQCLVLEARALADAGFRVILPDLPAHGARFKETPLTLDNALSTLKDVISKEAPGQKVVVMGFSMGGYVAAAFAAAHPELTAGVLMAACAHDAHTCTWKMVGRSAELVYKMCSYKTKSGFIYNSYPEVMSKSRPEVVECFLRAGAEFDSWQYTWRVMYDAHMQQVLPKISCPALVVVGEKDFRSHEQLWLSLLRKGRLLVLKGGIHQFMLQPGIVDTYRQHAISFATNAQWGEAGDAAAAGRPDSQAGAAAEQQEGEGRGMESQSGVALLAGADGQAVVIERKAAGAGVGLGEVIKNVWAQRRNKQD
uniref:AB hydrolase-1 domain-containing protein n=1 Tax=Tetradesmus obliquus TaxID=3088 RepID=A0A383VKF6_TETOB|eukprot:jgi/Sobl393_1/1216/SZX65423.1